MRKLYNVLDLGNKVLAKKKTSEEIESEFGISVGNVSRAARKGIICCGKYQIVDTEKYKVSMSELETAIAMAEKELPPLGRAVGAVN